jgi:hypothetical protein
MMLEVALDPVRLIAFDGRVLELFFGQGLRFHVAVLTVEVSGPDKKGFRTLTFKSQRTSQLQVDGEAFDRLRPILDALHAAGVQIVTVPR